jgi:hypothetical protein
MAYRRQFRSNARPQVRTLVVKYAGKCACCGATINVGELADYYPVGTIASRATPAIAHVGGLDGNSARCTAEIRKASDNAGVNDYAGEGLDMRWEDQGAEICGR